MSTVTHRLTNAGIIGLLVRVAFDQLSGVDEEARTVVESTGQR